VELTRLKNSLSDMFKMRERAVDISLDLLRHGVRAFQVPSEVLQAMSIQRKKLRPGLQAHFVRLRKSLTIFVCSISVCSYGDAIGFNTVVVALDAAAKASVLAPFTVIYQLHYDTVNNNTVP